MNEDFKEIFYSKLDIQSMDLNTQRNFLESISKYLDHGRKDEINGRTVNFVLKQLNQLISFLECVGYTKEEMVRIITNFPSILNTIDDLYNKYLFLGLLEDPSKNDLRKDKLLNKTKDFMAGFNKMYARYKLICETGYDRLSWNTLVHASDREFCSIFVRSTYRKSYQLFTDPVQVMRWLKQINPDEFDIEEVKTLAANKELVEKYEKRIKGIS